MCSHSECYAEPSASRPVTVNVTLTNTLLFFFVNGFAAEEIGRGFDIGADEFVNYEVYLPLVLR